MTTAALDRMNELHQMSIKDGGITMRAVVILRKGCVTSSTNRRQHMYGIADPLLESVMVESILNAGYA